MSIYAYLNDHASYTMNSSSRGKDNNVENSYRVSGTTIRTGTVSSQTEYTAHSSSMNWPNSVAKSGSQMVNGGTTTKFINQSTNTEQLELRDDSLFLNIPLHEDLDVLNECNVERGSEKPEAPPSTSDHEGDEDEEEYGEIDIQIRNVVCNYTLPLHIDLRNVALRSGNVSYDRGRGVLLKQKRNPSCYVKIYSSGKIYIVGCRSEDECKRAARGVARMVQKCMNRLAEVVRIRNYRVCNVLATCKMPFGIKIEELAQKYPEKSQYEPELSVGLIWRSTDPRATLRIHTTGSVTVTGASSEVDVMKVIENIYPIVREFRCALRLRESVAVSRARKRQKAVADFVPAKKTRNIQQPDSQYTQRGSSGQSGVYGNRVYFSDEDDEEDEFEDVV